MINSRVITHNADKRDLIRRLSEQGLDFALFFDDIPDGLNLITKLDEGVAVVSAPYDFDSLEKIWYSGNWHLVVPAKADFHPKDTFKMSETEINQLMQGSGLSIIVDSFHDNSEWKISEYA